MSVLSCSRRNCENIMCDRYSHEHGYICNWCFEELIETGPTTDIGEFMDSSARNDSSKGEAEAKYSSAFPLSY